MDGLSQCPSLPRVSGPLPPRLPYYLTCAGGWKDTFWGASGSVCFLPFRVSTSGPPGLVVLRPGCLLRGRVLREAGEGLGTFRGGLTRLHSLSVPFQTPLNLRTSPTSEGRLLGDSLGTTPFGAPVRRPPEIPPCTGEWPRGVGVSPTWPQGRVPAPGPLWGVGVLRTRVWPSAAEGSGARGRPPRAGAWGPTGRPGRGGAVGAPAGEPGLSTRRGVGARRLGAGGGYPGWAPR